MSRFLRGRLQRFQGSLPLVMLTLVVLIWSSNNIVTKLVLQDSTPALLTLVRFTMTTVLFWGPAFLVIRHLGQPLTRGNWIRLSIAAVTGYALSAMMFMVGISMTTATYAALMMMTGPLWTAVLERLFVGTRISLLQAAGMVIAFSAAAFLATGGSLGDADMRLLIGSLLLIGCQTSWGGYTILTKPLLARRPPLVIVSAASIIATPAIWGGTGVQGAWGDLGLVMNWSSMTWVGVVYLVFIAGVLSQVLYAYGLRDVSASQAMAFTYLMPVFTAFFAALFLDEQITLTTVICGAAIVFGLWLVNSNRAPAPSHSRRPAERPEPAESVPAAAPAPAPSMRDSS